MPAPRRYSSCHCTNLDDCKINTQKIEITTYYSNPFHYANWHRHIQRMHVALNTYRASGRFMKGRAEPPPPPSFGRRTDAVTHGTPNMWRRYCIIASLSPVYLFKHVKHGTQNIQNDCLQWISDSCRVHHFNYCHFNYWDRGISAKYSKRMFLNTQDYSNLGFCSSLL